ncbi:uncharacterized protein LAESUDRAFT_469252 [Laetiporus sulphureus 93-53]|uniref:Secreted protein n=1 Tax=Laetiporus sulphureus 93-53 TaxID=1314785 RepID=A0A165G9L8_9APHY|nr:uncharacterized protein LAESUDRAFT_469252 [Laetiporus sulphureus 93-53]KZT10031.1 hypothetical protein LAESUDRAFT_469252 [Laetiporus sulphureus 93-53]
MRTWKQYFIATIVICSIWPALAAGDVTNDSHPQGPLYGPSLQCNIYATPYAAEKLSSGNDT